MQNPSFQNEKKPYHSPNLKVFGDIRELTLAIEPTGSGDDGAGGYAVAGDGTGGVS
jgi:hypothetical protein